VNPSSKTCSVLIYSLRLTNKSKSPL